ncbi:hypothetical protein IHE45_14G105300 [Dioscorea alata]|uniref:Uncharacterized protein n=1 Tax=Dioscorea alata TaxID=55571 RepID=A0ACB7UTY2_DIOAL|nr:hypothetical protein IHE45_14G105300 [Dioscorea alata]
MKPLSLSLSLSASELGLSLSLTHVRPNFPTEKPGFLSRPNSRQTSLLAPPRPAVQLTLDKPCIPTRSLSRERSPCGSVAITHFSTRCSAEEVSSLFSSPFFLLFSQFTIH